MPSPCMSYRRLSVVVLRVNAADLRHAKKVSVRIFRISKGKKILKMLANLFFCTVIFDV
jgi:hypothetical protein